MNQEGLSKITGYILILVGYILIAFTDSKIGQYLITISVGIFVYHTVNAINYSQDKVRYKFRLWFIALFTQVLFTLAMNTFRLNGIFSLFAVAVLISFLDKGEWYWVHTFVVLALIIPNEYCLLSIGVAIVYRFYYKKDIGFSLKEIYYIINLVVIIILVNPIYFVSAVLSLIITKEISKVKNINIFTIKRKYCYKLLITCYGTLFLIRLYLLQR